MTSLIMIIRDYRGKNPSFYWISVFTYCAEGLTCFSSLTTDIMEAVKLK